MILRTVCALTPRIYITKYHYRIIKVTVSHSRSFVAKTLNGAPLAVLIFTTKHT